MGNTHLNVIYISKEKIIKFSQIYLVSTLLFFLIYMINFNIAVDLLYILFCIICFCILILSISTLKFTYNKFFVLSGIAFSTMGIFRTLNIISYIKTDIFMLYSNFFYLVEILYIIFSYLTIEKENLDNRLLKIFLGAVFIFLIIFSIMYNKFHHISNIIFYGLTFILYLVANFYLLKYPIIAKKSFNYLSIFLIFLSISNLLNIYISFFSNNEIVMIFMYFTRILAYEIIYLSIIEKLLKKPYKVLFRDLYLNNKKIKETNIEILEKNRELEQTQKVIREWDNMFKDVFHNIPLPMIILSNKNQRIIYANQRFLNLLKLKSSKSVVNKTIYQFITIKEMEHYEKSFNSENEKIFEGEAILKDKKIYLEIQVFTVKEESFLIFKDITEIKRVNKIKVRVEEKVLEEKMRNDFLSNISHDLKTPINVIFSAVQLENLLISNNNYDSLTKYNFVNKENCTTLIRLTNNLIDISKISYDYLIPQLQILNIVEFVEEFSNGLIEYMKSKDIEFIFDTEEEELYVKGDKDFLERIILNILSNSIKYSEGKSININIKHNKEKVYIIIKDTGKGMDNIFIKNAFNRYATGNKHDKTLEKGTGIGLYVVKNLVELQGGKISLESVKNYGTTVTLEFERYENYGR